MLEEFDTTALNDLKKLRNNNTVLYYGFVDQTIIPIFYEYLRRYKSIDTLDLVLITLGGDVNAARSVALLLRDYVTTVPYVPG